MIRTYFFATLAETTFVVACLALLAGCNGESSASTSAPAVSVSIHATSAAVASPDSSSDCLHRLGAWWAATEY
jgi:hypothetical protein